MKKWCWMFWCSICFSFLLCVTACAEEITAEEFWNQVKSQNTVAAVLGQHASFEEEGLIWYANQEGGHSSGLLTRGYEANNLGYGQVPFNCYEYYDGKDPTVQVADTAFGTVNSGPRMSFMGDNPRQPIVRSQTEQMISLVSDEMAKNGVLNSDTSATFSQGDRRIEVEVQDTISWNINCIQYYVNAELEQEINLSYSDALLSYEPYQLLRAKFDTPANQVTIEDTDRTYVYYLPDDVPLVYWYDQVAKDLFYDAEGTRSAQPIMRDGVRGDTVLYVRDSIQHTLTVLSTNDTHARAAGDDSSSYGLARVKTLLEDAEVKSDKALLLDAGDTYHGQAFATLEQGESIARLLKAVGYDAMTAGNHDWNYGKEQLKELEKLSGGQEGNFSILCGNVTDENGSPFFETPYLMEEIPIKEITTAEGNPTITIGVFGMIDPAVYHSTAPANVEGLQFTDLVEYTEKMTALLTKKGCDFIIGLVHGTNPKELAVQTEGVSLWISGHEHMVINEQVNNKNGIPVWVQQAGYYGSAVNEFQFSFRVNPGSTSSGEQGYFMVQTDCTVKTYGADELPSVARNADIQSLYQQIADGQQSVLQQKIGQTPSDLVAGWENVRIGETTMGRVITDAYLLETGAEIAFENAGGIRTKGTVPAGEIRKETAIDTFPFGNYLVTKKLTGNEIKEALETTLELGRLNRMANDSGEYDAWPANSGSYLQVGGVEAHYDLTLEKGSRIWSLKVDGQPIVADRSYTVAMNNFLAGSSDYPMIAAAQELNQFAACDEAFIRYFEASGMDSKLLVNTLQTVRLGEKTKPEVSVPESSELESAAPENSEPASSVPESSEVFSSLPESAGSLPAESEYEQSKAGTGTATGDSNMLVVLFVVLGVSVVAIVILLVYKRRK